jgi:hypothetical protein
MQFGTGQKSMHTSHPVQPSSTMTAINLGRFFALTVSAMCLLSLLQRWAIHGLIPWAL